MLSIRVLLFAALALSASAQNYIEVCSKTETPWPQCRGIRLGSGLELTDDEIRIVPTTTKPQVILSEYLVFSEETIRTQRVQTVPAQFAGMTIMGVYWGDRVMTRVGPTQVDACQQCWSEGDSPGGRTLLFGTLEGFPEGLRRAIVVHYVRVGEQSSSPEN